MLKQTSHYAITYRYAFKCQRVTLMLLLLLMCSVQAGCHTVKPTTNSTLKGLQEWATPEPLDRLSPPREQVLAKAAMVRWIEQYLKDEYRVVDQRFVLTQSGFTDGAAIGSKAIQYVTQNLGGVLQTQGWYDDDNYMLFVFAFGDSSPRYIAFVMTRDFLPGTRERSLVGYCELAPSQKHQHKTSGDK